MLRKKKLIMFIGFLVLFLLLSCQKGSDDEKINLRISFWDKIDPENANFIVGFEEQYPNINIEVVEISPDEYANKLNAMVIAGNEPDVIIAWESDIKRYIDNGIIIELNDYIDETDAFVMDDLVTNINIMNDEGVSGVYGLPWCYAVALLYYNKDMFDEAGISYPTDDWTWQDFEDAAVALTKRDTDGKVTQWGASGVALWDEMAGAAGDDIANMDGKLLFGNGLRRALEYQYKLTHDLKVIPEPVTGASIIDPFASGTTAMSKSGSWFIPNYKDLDFKWDIALLPMDKRHYSTLFTGWYTIASKSKNKDAAWKFIEYMMSDEGQRDIGELLANPPSRRSLDAEGAYRVGGDNGPTYWEAIPKSSEFARLAGFVNGSIKKELLSQLDAYLLNRISLEEVLDEVDRLNKQVDELNSQ